MGSAAEGGFGFEAGFVEEEEAVDDFVFEGREGGGVVGGGGAVGRDGDVGPAVGGEDGGVEVFVLGAQGEDARVCVGWVFKRVVGLGQALVGVEHVRARGVEGFAQGFELVDDALRIRVRKGEGFEAVGGGVAEPVSHRRGEQVRPEFVDAGLETAKAV